MTTALLIPLLLVPLDAHEGPDQESCLKYAPQHTQAASQMAENTVRLRKLHLVRPELIPYPLAYEVYC